MNTILQLSMLTRTLKSSNSPPKNVEILLIYYISLSWSRIRVVYVAMNMGEY